MPKTVLIVDDDNLFQAAIGDGLRAAGYEVAVASNGLEALERVREAPPDFILLDLIMPKLDGSRTCQILKRHPQHRAIPIIILTGLGGHGVEAVGELEAEAAVPKRQAEATLAEILKTLSHIESAPQKPRPQAEPVVGLTERRIVSELLAERRHTQTLLATLGEGVVELDDRGQVVYINHAGLRMLDRPEDEILGGAGSDLLGAANAPALQRGLCEVQAGGEGHTVRLELPHAQKTIGVSLTALRRPAGPSGGLLVLRDLTNLARRAQGLEALAALDQHILGKLDLNALLQKIVTRTAELLGVERCGLFRIERAGDRLRLRCIQAVGLSEGYARDLHIAPGEAVVGRAVEERRTVFTSDLLRDPAIPVSAAVRALVQEEGIEAVLAAPIVLQDEVYGTLTAYRPAGHEFTPEEVELVTSLAGSAAIAIENARLFRQEQERRRQLEAVRDVTGEIVRELDLTTLLGLINRRAVELVGAGSGAVYLWDEADQVLIPQAWHGRGEWMREVRFRLGEGLVGTVAERRERAIINDYQTYPFASPFFVKRPGVTAALAEPLLYRDRLLGVITLDNYGIGRPFTAQDRETLALFAAQAAIAIENARLFEETKRQAEEQGTLNAIAAATSRSVDLREVLDLALESSLNLLRMDFGVIRLLNETKERLVLATARGLRRECPGELGEMPVGEGFSGQLAHSREPVYVEDVPADPRFIRLGKVEGAASAIGVPLTAKGGVVGAMTLFSRSPRQFEPRPTELLSAVGHQIGMATENARLFESTRQREEHLRALLETNKKIGGPVPLDVLLASIAEEAARILAVDGAGFRLLEGDELVLAGVWGEAREAMRLPRIRRDESMSGWVVTNGQPLVISNVAEDPRLIEEHRQEAQRLGHRAFLGVPLKVGERVTGVLTFRAKGGRQFTDQDVQLATAFADQAAIAIENARLYEESQRRAREATALAEVGRTLSSSLDMDRVLELMVQEVRRVMGVPFAGIMALDEERQELTYVKAAGLSLEELAGVRLKVGEGIAGRALEQGAPMHSSSLPDDPRYVSLGLAETQGFRSLLCAPLLAGGRPLGVLAVLRKDEHDFAPTEGQLLAGFAAQAAIAMENARLFGEVSRSKAEWEYTFDSIADMVAVLDLEGRIVRANRALLGRMGLPPEQVHQRACTHVFGDDGEAWGGCPHQQAVRLGASVSIEVEDARLGGIYAVSVFPVRDAAGQIMGTVHIARDITEQKAIQAKLSQTDKLASVGTLAAGVAHSINNVLGAIVARADLLLASATDPGTRRSADVILQAAMDGAETVRRLRDFTKIQRPGTASLVDVNQAVRDALELTQARWRDEAQARGAPIIVEMRLEAGGPIEANVGEIREVLVNLILNAVDAMPGGGRLRIVTADRPGPPSLGRERPAAGTVEVRVEDSGLGMAEAVRRRIFDPFFTTKGVTGTGLGLSVSYGLVAKHRGEIAFRSREGQGTTFVLTFPAARAGAGTPAAPAMASPPRLGHVLLIEDESNLREAMAEALTLAGHQVEAVAGGREGIERFQAGAFDVVVTDLGMPEVSGLDVARAVKGADPSVYVILCTGWGNVPGAEGPLKERGVDVLLAKPFRIDEVDRAVRAGLETQPDRRGWPLPARASARTRH